jgi:hypothetical protein
MFFELFNSTFINMKPHWVKCKLLWDLLVTSSGHFQICLSSSVSFSGSYDNNKNVRQVVCLALDDCLIPKYLFLFIFFLTLITWIILYSIALFRFESGFVGSFKFINSFEYNSGVILVLVLPRIVLLPGIFSFYLQFSVSLPVTHFCVRFVFLSLFFS